MKISKMKLIATYAAAAILMFSCNGGGDSQTETTDPILDTTEIRDTVVVNKDSTRETPRPDSVFSGAYQGIFPCPDCDGIQQTILFNPDKTYRQGQVIWGENEFPKTFEGTWKIKNRRIELDRNGKRVITFIKKRDSLFAVNISGIEIKNSSKYFLTKRSMARDNPIWIKKQKAGIDFAGIGNDPFWNLEIDKQKFILFKLADWKKPIIVPAEKPLMIKDSMIYNLKSDTIKWAITIFPQFCNDGLSDYLYQYRVNVNYNGLNYKGCGIMLSKVNLKNKNP